MPERKYHIVLYGATGFTGRLVAEYLGQHAPQDVRWAIAGRNARKLEEVAAGLGNSSGDGRPEQLIADSHRPDQLEHMCAQTDIIISTVGPFSMHGENLVAACVKTGTHYLDITGEPEFANRILKKYHQPAAERGVLIVNSCGFDSIPADLGAWYTAALFSNPESLSIRAFVTSKGSLSGGTWASVVHGMSLGRKKNLASKSDASSGKSGPGGIHYDKVAGKWAVPLPLTDPWVVARTARDHPHRYGTDFHYHHYIGVRSLFTVALMGAAAMTVYTGAQLSPLRKLLLRIRPSGSGPDEAKRAKGFFRVTFYAESGDQKKIAYIQGGDPGYTETAKMISEAALTLLLNYERLPAKGGVVTPAAAFGDLLIDRLKAAGILFAVKH